MTNFTRTTALLLITHCYEIIHADISHNYPSNYIYMYLVSCIDMIDEDIVDLIVYHNTAMRTYFKLCANGNGVILTAWIILILHRQIDHILPIQWLFPVAAHVSPEMTKIFTDTQVSNVLRHTVQTPDRYLVPLLKILPSIVFWQKT